VSTIGEIENALRALPVQEARAVADWLQDYLEEQWDKQMEADAANGRVDRAWEKAKADIAAGRVKPLDEIIDDE
jgi:hypothetical protein